MTGPTPERSADCRQRMAIEFELKLDLDEPEVVDALVRALDLETPRTVRMRAIYFDTPDQRLAKLGYSVRIRQEGHRRVQTIKCTGGPGTGPFARQEWEQPARGRAPLIEADHPLGAALGADAAGLAPSFEILTDRSAWRILDTHADIELVVDRSEALAAGASTRFTEIELELKRGDPSALFVLARRIGRLTPVRVGVLTKAERAHRLMKPPGPCDKARPVRLHPDMAAAEAFRIVAHSCLRHYRLNEARLLEDDSMQALHQARVALRRLRSALVAFGPIVRGADARRFSADLRWLTGQLGGARNIDVLIPLVHDKAARAKLKVGRQRAYVDARRAAASALARELMLDIAEWLAVGRWTGRKKRRPLREESARAFGAKAIARLHDRLMETAQAIGGPDDEARHTARKTAKKLRYTVEFFALAFDEGKERKARIRYLATLEDLQDHLGALNDLAVMPRVLAEQGVEATPPESGAREGHIALAAQAMAKISGAKRFWE